MARKENKRIRFAFFGTPEFAVGVLNELEEAGYLPSVVVTGLDKPHGRHLVMTPPPAKVWAVARNIPVMQPVTLKDGTFARELGEVAPDEGWDLFIVAAYGKIIPGDIINLPAKKTLNVHPSLLPRLRGASPIQSAILEEDGTGVSIMRIDEEMDHGPIVLQRKVDVPDWPPRHDVLEELLAREGGRLLAEALEPWMDGGIVETEQDHSKATYCKKITKEDGKVDFEDDPETNLRKICAFSTWPGAYYFQSVGDKFMRIVIKEAELRKGELVLKRIVPEGKREMDYQDFMRNIRT